MNKTPNFDCKWDVRVRDDEGHIIATGPRFFRCQKLDCGSLVTRGMIQEYGACECGGTRVAPAMRVKPDEQQKILNDEFPMLPWEKEMLYASF